MTTPRDQPPLDETPSRRVQRMQADLDGIRAHNAERLQALAAQQVQVSFTEALIGHVVDAVFPEGTEDRVGFLRSWEDKVAALLDDIEAQVRRQRLLAPGTPPPANGRST